jgi:RHS repeat-associated protein
MNIQDITLMNGVPADRKYARDASGNVTSIATSSSAPGQPFGPTDVQCFAYDGLQNLTEAWTSTAASCEAPASSTIGGAAPYWSSYTFDKATGNRLTATQNPVAAGGATVTDTYAYPAGGSARPHAVKTVTPSSGDARSYSYDAAGNATARPGQALTWDDLGRLVAVKSGSKTQTRVYDAEGTLLLQSDSVSGTTLFVGSNEFTIAPGASAASGVRTYSMGDAPLAQRVSKVGVSGTTLQWLGGDANNTQDLQMDEKTGEIVHRYVDPYGNPRGAAVSWGSSRGYLNKPTSSVTGLTHLGARDYDPSIGKFLSVDPVLAPGNPRQNNGYGYSANNPITLSDPDGKCYVSGKDSINFNPNCGGGKGISAPQVAGQSQYIPQPGTYDDWSTKNKGANHSVKGRWKDTNAALMAPLTPEPRGLGAYQSQLRLQQYNSRLESARTKETGRISALAELDLDPGAGVCGDFGLSGVGVSFCSVKTLDGELNTTVSLAGGVGGGADVYIGASAITTNAESRAQLEGWEAGWTGAIGEVGVIYGGSSVSIPNPSVSTTRVGVGIGGGAYIGGNVGHTWAW